jgi:phospholipase/carboxylesterase
MSQRSEFVTNGVSRRRFGCLAGGAFMSLALDAACRGTEAGPAEQGRITARPRRGVSTTATGTQTLGIGGARDAILQLPPNVAAVSLPLLVLLHGAGGSGAGILRRLGATAGDAGIAVLAPDSRDSSWDAIRGTFGRDVAFLTLALQKVFEMTALDPARMAIGGFSDGASYAISLGLINGDLFRRVLAFSPGFFVGETTHGKPQVFVSHGKGDQILPIDRCSRQIVPSLQKRGYDVTFREFDGGHTVPPEVAAEGMRWAAR